MGELDRKFAEGSALGAIIAPFWGDLSTSPDWALGVLFGVGGFAGMYIGARHQKYVFQKFIKLMLGIMITSLASNYITQYFA